MRLSVALCGKEIINREHEIGNLKKPSKTEKFLGAKFRQQMKLLMDELLSSDCHFIRCLKPNEQKQRGVVVETFCMQQIKYLGVLESIRVRKEGFPFRKDYK
jgi:myosin-7